MALEAFQQYGIMCDWAFTKNCIAVKCVDSIK